MHLGPLVLNLIAPPHKIDAEFSFSVFNFQNCIGDKIEKKMVQKE